MRVCVVAEYTMSVQDANADRVRGASRSMAASLAVSLAAVTCRDALNSGLMTHLQHALETVVASHAVADIATLLCRTNHPVGCEYVERMALDRAMKDIEDHMAPVCPPYFAAVHVVTNRCWTRSRPTQSSNSGANRISFPASHITC